MTRSVERISVQHLQEAVELLGEDLSEDVRARAADVIERVYTRDSLDPMTIVAAYVGATGSGKSSLFNAVLGEDIASTDVIRPTTRVALAAVPTQHGTGIEGHPNQGGGALLDWMGVGNRVEMPPTSGLDSSLVVVDAPDIDSIDRENWQISARLADRMDLLVWVVDPQKYADDVIHSRWIRPMASRAQATIVVLNQVDRLSVDERENVVRSLRAILLQDGLNDPTIVLTSALTGEGIESLKAHMNERAVFLRQVAVTREAQIRDIACDVVREVELGEWHPQISVEQACEGIARLIAQSAPVESVVSTVGKSYMHRRVRACGWLPLRFLRGLRSDPLSRWHMSGAGSDSVSDIDLSGLLNASGVSVALRHSVESLAQGRPECWAYRLREIAWGQEKSLTEAIGRGITRTDLGVGGKPGWWSISSVLQWLMWCVALCGGLWLAGVHALRSYLLIPAELPVYGRVPIPTLLLMGGLAASILVALVSAGFGVIGAWRRRRQARVALHKSVAEVVDLHLRSPLELEDGRQRQIVGLISS